MTLAIAWLTLNSSIFSSLRDLLKFDHGAGGKDGGTVTLAIDG